MKCRHCDSALDQTLVDLGHAPLSNAYIAPQGHADPEIYYPLKVNICTSCWLVQTEDYARPQELFQADYSYFSSTSDSWLRHARTFCDRIQSDLDLNSASFVVEVASNDGYLLKNFLRANIPCLGIEPTADTASAARKLGLEVLEEFFGESCAKEVSLHYGKADLVVGNNVFAHVPDINDFANGIRELLKDDGTVTLEFPHLLRLVEHCQFDTIYHEHFSYLSLIAVNSIFDKAGLHLWDAVELPTHGGSLRVFGALKGRREDKTDRLLNLLDTEKSFGLESVEGFSNFQNQTTRIKNKFLEFLLDCRNKGKTIAAYGAAAKGNTLLNYAGVKKDLLPYVVDAAAAKQGKLMPGSRIPIHSPEKLFESPPDIIVILPWNIAEEVKSFLQPLAQAGVEILSLHPDIISFD